MTNGKASELTPTTLNMKANGPKIITQLFEHAGVRLNGDAPWDMTIYDDIFFQKMFAKWELGIGESYMDGDWDSVQLDEFFFKITSHDLEQTVAGPAKLRFLLEIFRQKFFNLQTKRRAFQVGEQHYDIGNDLFESMLDSNMMYSCGYWEHATTLEEAQLHKLELICRKLELKPGEKLLDIGCGWGGLARYAAEKYQVEVVGITISVEQQKLAQERCAGLPVTISLTDYRELSGQFDKIVSVGMFEHVGAKNYTTYFDVVEKLLKPKGLFLLHTIGNYVTENKRDMWLDKYIFPNGHLPSAKQIASALEGRFLIDDWHNFGRDYDRTLMAWWDNFEKAWPALADKYGERFYRMWKYFLLSSAGFFRSGQGQLWQVVLSKRDRQLTYRSVRGISDSKIVR
ncbi:cyclopropane fatty acyl phospholipid synthase [Glaciimonas immobilis]|uniref:Cyclopropane-fatty-acyl-phospholipid synthase n=1 Tax=Glaciimonas immobilis TaxID=728004 RepID=A0A840RWB2_9BURK|nr:cyclopropane fatty acyl phospholipid synthase [Glaciimonas immobilis]KAF3997474.1 cyclopropane fatty acyl phospholipid synthase [Glaciimonas immobilis]MBB5200851.1 cyclopropane-fatty-acyl-phospholipid synthase [Glaciimonas immobilis]